MKHLTPIALLLLGIAAAVLGADDKTPAAAGWHELFNGKDLSNFEQIGSAKWRVEDGVIVGGQDGDPKRSGLLTTKEQFQDFERSCKTKLSTVRVVP